MLIVSPGLRRRSVPRKSQAAGSVRRDREDDVTRLQAGVRGGPAGDGLADPDHLAAGVDEGAATVTRADHIATKPSRRHGEIGRRVGRALGD
jgi:hypothetical protein